MEWDQRKLVHKRPCKDCPFKKSSAKGYLGGFPVKTYAKPPEAGMPTTCHNHDRGADDPHSRFCAGSLATISNDPAISPLPDYADAVASVEGNASTFDNMDDFRNHHKNADAIAWRYS